MGERQSQLLQHLHNERERFAKELGREKRTEHQKEQIEHRKLQRLTRILRQIQAQGHRELELVKTKGLKKLNEKKKKEAAMLAAAKRRTAYLLRQIALEKVFAAQRMERERLRAREAFEKARDGYVRKIET